jgi:DNA-binding transcriptional MerR regulator
MALPTSKTKTERMLIGQLAKLAGVKPDTVRFYERNALLPRPERTAAGYRLYDEAALKRLRFIKRAQALGFSLDEIRRVLSLRGQGASTCRCVLSMAEATLSETEAKLKQLQSFHDALAANLQKWRKLSSKGADLKAEFCKLIESV